MGAQPSIPDTLRQLGLTDDDLAAWEHSGLAERDFPDWLTDRVGRHPAGARAREVYGADDVHDFARRVLLDALALGPADHLLDVGCGDGMLLRDALARGARATGVDHSEEMVDLARTRAPGATVVEGAAEALPFGDRSFTAVSMSIVLMFLPDPAVALAECHRVLARGGRLAVYTTSADLSGTPACPEPLAGRCSFHDDDELRALAEGAGFTDIAVERDDGAQLLTARARGACQG